MQRLLPGSEGDAANLALYHTAGGDSRSGTASFKVDGSLIIGFLWGGELRTTTRRRMDSEQVCVAGGRGGDGGSPADVVVW